MDERAPPRRTAPDAGRPLTPRTGLRDHEAADAGRGWTPATTASRPDDHKAYYPGAGWHPALVDTVRLWDTATVQALKCRSCVPVDAWEPSTITVMGDAVHAMSPALGIGANTALRDAHTLGGQLLAVASGDKPLLAGIAGYEQAMRDYAYHALRMSAFVGQKVIGHLPLPE